VRGLGESSFYAPRSAVAAEAPATTAVAG
jgi:hypothetical protein